MTKHKGGKKVIRQGKRSSIKFLPADDPIYTGVTLLEGTIAVGEPSMIRVRLPLITAMKRYLPKMTLLQTKRRNDMDRYTTGKKTPKGRKSCSEATASGSIRFTTVVTWSAGRHTKSSSKSTAPKSNIRSLQEKQIAERTGQEWINKGLPEAARNQMSEDFPSESTERSESPNGDKGKG